MPTTETTSATRSVLARIHALAQIAWRNAPEALPSADRRALIAVRDLTAAFADELPEENDGSLYGADRFPSLAETMAAHRETEARRETLVECRACSGVFGVDELPPVAKCPECTSNQLRTLRTGS